MTAKSKTTGERWKLGTSLTNEGGRPVVSEVDRVCVVDCFSPFKRGRGHEAECSVRDYRARLIAKAPQMADALRAIVDCYGFGHKTAEKFVEHVGPFIQEARALLSEIEE